jgi:glycosyltransferase involved in cell wall biosynthesis
MGTAFQKVGKMKVCLIGHFADPVDEGVRNVGTNIGRELEHKGIEVRRIEISSVGEWKSLRAFRPDVIHSVLTPTTRGIITVKLVSHLYPRAKTVLSAVHPSVWRHPLLKCFRPDLTLVQAKESERSFKSLGFNTRFFPNGVRTNKFKPIAQRDRQRLREKFGLPAHSFVVLHLASMQRERNLDVFKIIQKEEDFQVLIIGRENERADTRLQRELQDAGCLVWTKHFSDIEAVYNLSDCYVFPTLQSKACIETPLSVLEAMACNLPIVTTRFGALPRLFVEDNGLFFVDDVDAVPRILQDIKHRRPPIDTRRLVLLYSWDTLADELIDMYEQLLRSEDASEG